MDDREKCHMYEVLFNKFYIASITGNHDDILKLLEIMRNIAKQLGKEEPDLLQFYNVILEM